MKWWEQRWAMGIHLPLSLGQESQEPDEIFMSDVQGTQMKPVLHTRNEKWRAIGGATEEWDG